MPRPVTTRVQKFEFNHHEFYTATRFSELQLMLFQTLIAEAVEEKSSLKIDLSSGKAREEAVTEYIQREADLQGTIAAYEHLLMLATSTEVPTAEEAGEVKTVVSSKT